MFQQMIQNAYELSVDFDSSDVDDTLGIFKYFLEKHDIK